MDEFRTLESILVLIGTFIVLIHCENHDEIEDHLLCRRCGHEIAEARSLKQIPSDLAKRQRNDTILGVDGVLIQLFKNPQGAYFEVITTKKANIVQHGEAYSEHSWFPGFAWRIAVCPQCGFHVGWSFESEDHHHHHHHEKSDPKIMENYSFVGLILSNVIHQTYAESLIYTPKAYNS